MLLLMEILNAMEHTYIHIPRYVSFENFSTMVIPMLASLNAKADTFWMW